MYYCQENRAKIKNENPQMNFSEMAKAMGSAWKSLDVNEKAKYEEVAKLDKLRYEKELAEHNKSEPDHSTGQ